jgi:hypothetical protein
MPGGVAATNERFAFISQMVTPGINRISLNELVQDRSGTLCGRISAMGRRTELCLDQPKPPTDARLRTLRRNRRSLRPSRNDPAHAQTLDKAKPLLMNPFFLDRL